MPPTCTSSFVEVEEFVGYGASSGSKDGAHSLVPHYNVIEREMNNLDAKEQAANWQLVKESMLKELKSWNQLGSWEKIDRKDVKNIIDARWVATWKMIGGEEGN